MMKEAIRWRKHILIVDDEEILRCTLHFDIEEMGYRATAVGDGETALAVLQEQYYDLVLTDLCMEGISGIDVLQGVKAKSPETMVVILTGFGDISSAIEALRNGADDYLLKPYVYEDLAMRLRNCLEKQEMKKRLKVYENFLPICSVCKKIRNDKGKEPGSGEWLSVEEYLHREAGMLPSHSYCPDCYATAMQSLEEGKSARKE